MTLDNVTTYVDNNPGLLKEIERLEIANKKLVEQIEDLKVEIKVLERLLDRFMR
jgi:predicted RNase H-like nuclease (RuvC/YqgF family)